MRSLLAILGLSLVGCAFDSSQGAGDMGEGSAPGASDGAVASKVEAAVVLPWVTGPFRWNQGDPLLPMQPVADFLCVLTRVSGRFGGGGESVAVVNDGNFWYLGGSSQQAGVGGEAHCFARSRFVANGTDGGTSGQFVAATSGGGVGHRCFGANRTNTFWGDAATAISTIQGMMNGGGEAVTIVQSANAFAPSNVGAESCAIAPLWGTATSFWFGTASSGKLATFQGPTGTLGTVNQIAESSASGNGGVAVLAPVGQSVCYFTAIRGGFFGGGEWVQIRSELIGSVSHWVLRTGKGGASSFVSASARCFARDQR